MDLGSNKDTIFQLPCDYQITDLVKIDFGGNPDIIGEVIGVKFSETGRINYDLLLFLAEYNTLIRDVDEWFLKPYNKNIEDKV